jgi:transposase
MVHPYDEETRRQVIHLWLNGYTYREIEDTTKVSIATVSKFVTEELERDPRLEDYIKLSKAIKETNRNLKELQRAADFLDRLDQNNLTLTHVDQTLKLLATHPDDAQDLLRQADMLLTQERYGKPYYETVNRYIQITNGIEHLTQENRDLVDEKQRLLTELVDLHDLQALRQQVQATDYPISKVADLITNQIKIEKLGFTPETANILAEALSEIGTTPRLAVIIMKNELHENETLLDRNIELHNVKQMTIREIRALETQRENLIEEIKNTDLTLGAKQTLITQNDNTLKEQKDFKQFLQAEIEDLLEQRVLAENELKEVEKKLIGFLAKTRENQTLQTCILLLTQPRAPINGQSVANAFLKLTLNYLEYIKHNPIQTLNPLMIKSLLEAVIGYLHGDIAVALQ